MLLILAKRISLSFLLLISIVGTAQAEGILYRFSDADGRNHYLFGTMHSDDPRVIALLDRLEAPLQQVDQVVLEISPDLVAVLAAGLVMMLPPDQKLTELLDKRLYTRVSKAVEKMGVPAVAMERMKPWALAVLLSTPTLKGDALDQALYKRAQQAGKTVVGLETAEEQLAFFDALSRDMEIRMLELALEQQEKLPMQLETLTKAYLKRDLPLLQSLSLEYEADGEAALGEWFREQLIRRRNQRMMTRLLPLLDQGSVLVAVGALHLVGDDGLISQLRLAGYPVEAVY